MLKQTNYVALLALGACSACACASKEPERPMTPAAYTPPSSAMTRLPASPLSQPAPMTMTDADRSARAIAAARCEREVRCDNIGQEKEYVTEEDCLSSLEPDTIREVGVQPCPGGFPAIQLNECIEEIRAESCDNPLEDVARVSECRMNALCPQ